MVMQIKLAVVVVVIIIWGIHSYAMTLCLVNFHSTGRLLSR